TVTYDATNPTSAASVPDYETSASFSVAYTASDPGANEIGRASGRERAKGATDGSFSRVATDSTPSASGSFNYSATEGDGTYRFYTVAYDEAGKHETKSVADDSTLLDTANPTSAASVPDYETSASFSVAYTASDPGAN